MPPRRLVQPLTALVTALLISLIALSTAIYATTRVLDPPWNPLGEYPVQTVLNRADPASTSPALRLGDQVEVTGSKCNATADNVTIVGTTSWVSVEPPGTALDVGGGTAVRVPGCTTRTFKNPIPPVVAERVRDLHDRGVTRSIWFITGTETPTRDDGPDGVKRVWVTENFTIIAED